MSEIGTRSFPAPGAATNSTGVVGNALICAFVSVTVELRITTLDGPPFRFALWLRQSVTDTTFIPDTTTLNNGNAPVLKADVRLLEISPPLDTSIQFNALSANWTSVAETQVQRSPFKIAPPKMGTVSPLAFA